MEEYIPKPIDLSDVSLTDDLIELREAIAENAHEIWAENRRLEGWKCTKMLGISSPYGQGMQYMQLLHGMVG